MPERAEAEGRRERPWLGRPFTVEGRAEVRLREEGLLEAE